LLRADFFTQSFAPPWSLPIHEASLESPEEAFYFYTLDAFKVFWQLGYSEASEEVYFLLLAHSHSQSSFKEEQAVPMLFRME